jgi:ribosomal protein S17E
MWPDVGFENSLSALANHVNDKSDILEVSNMVAGMITSIRSVAQDSVERLKARFNNKFATAGRIVTGTQNEFSFFGHERNSRGPSNAPNNRTECHRSADGQQWPSRASVQCSA